MPGGGGGKGKEEESMYETMRKGMVKGVDERRRNTKKSRARVNLRRFPPVRSQVEPTFIH